MISLSPELEKRVRAQLQMQWIVWTMMTMSILILVFAAHNAAASGSSPPRDVDQLKSVLQIVALLLIAASLAVSSWGKSDKRINSSMNYTLSAHAPLAAQAAVLSESEKRVFRTVAGGFVPFVVALALSEAASIQGFIIALQSHDPAAIHPFIAGSLLANIVSLPNARTIADKAVRLPMSGQAL